MAVLLNETEIEYIKNICSAFNKNMSYVTYEEGTAYEQSKIYPQKMDENGILTCSSIPERKRLILAALIFKQLSGSETDIDIISDYPYGDNENIVGSADLDPLAEDVFGLMRELLRQCDIVCFDFKERTDFDTDYREIFNTEDGAEKFISALYEDFRVSVSDADASALLNDAEGFTSADCADTNYMAFFICGGKVPSYLWSALAEAFLYDVITSDKLGPSVFVVNGLYNGQPGVFVYISWGLYDAYYDIEVQLSSIDFFGLVSRLLFLRQAILHPKKLTLNNNEEVTQ